MWIARPIYELLPYLYMVVGAALLAIAWFLNLKTIPGVLLVVGSLSMLAGIVLWLRRKDYRTRQAEYSNKSLED
jgi:hypothetical protein